MPSCSWAPAKLVGESVGESVAALSPQWGTQIAPVLSCRYVERVPHVQVAGAPLVTIEFREQQMVRPPAGAVSLSHLGSCVSAVSCPARGHPAWLYTVTGFGTAAASPYAVKFSEVEALEVEDGVNQLTILVQSPDGPLPVAGESGALERLGRRLLPLFYWS